MGDLQMFFRYRGKACAGFVILVPLVGHSCICGGRVDAAFPDTLTYFLF